MIRSVSTAASLVAVVVVTATTGVLAVSAPAEAAACRGADGVTVIVDFNELGGGVTAGCDPDGAGEVATEVFADAGYTLDFVQSDPGFVCRVAGSPADSPCVRTPPASAYWSLWWSDGESGRWVFSNQGVGGLEVPDGGYVAFAWHEGAGNAQPPDVVPTAHVEPSEDPTDGGDGGNDGGNGNDGGSAGGNNGGRGDGDDPTTTDATTSSAPATTATASTTTEATSESASGQGRKPSDERSDRATDPTSVGTDLVAAGDITAGPPSSDLATDTSGDDGDALPTWIGLGLAALVLGAAGAVTVLRRRTG